MSLRLGLVGWPVGHSLSPRIFDLLAERLKVKLSYCAIAVTAGELAGELASLAEDGYAGVNVTIPHKQAAARLVDALTPEAERIGAVNTVRFSGGKSKGHNTDAAGFLDALGLLEIGPKGLDAVVFGAGGAARAVGWALGKARARKVRFSARRPAEAAKLARELGAMFEETAFSAGESRPAGLWVNATPLGMDGFPDESPAEKFAGCAAFDLVYGRETAFLKQARAAGARTQGGFAMLVFQALRGWEFWTKPLGEARRLRLASEIVKELR
ncbi:MAG: shikimate dehydrogenase [Elusimicrobia bacterium]|nr:shikimate dehydrogenase [Elusimicrobiota bacterium]